MTQTEETWQPTRQTLLSRLKDWGDDKSWREFFNLYWRLIYSVAKRAGLSDSEAQDVVQETIVTVAKQIAEFRYDRSKGSFRSWLCNTTRWKIKDQFKRRQRQERMEEEQLRLGGEVEPENGAQFESLWADEWEQNLVEAAVERVKAQVEPREFQVFNLFTVKGWPAARVARNLNMIRPKVYYLNQKVARAIHRESRRLRDEME